MSCAFVSSCHPDYKNPGNDDVDGLQNVLLVMQDNKSGAHVLPIWSLAPSHPPWARVISCSSRRNLNKNKKKRCCGLSHILNIWLKNRDYGLRSKSRHPCSTSWGKRRFRFKKKKNSYINSNFQSQILTKEQKKAISRKHFLKTWSLPGDTLNNTWWK